MSEVSLKITSIIGSHRAISADDAQNLFKQIDSAISKGKRVILDFSDLELLLSVFLNVAIGQLYSKYDSPFLNSHIENINISEDDRLTLEKVIERAKQYFEDKDRFDETAENSFS